MKNTEGRKQISDSELVKYIAGELAKSEKAKINNWLSSHENNMKYFQKLENIWNITGKLNDIDLINVQKARKKVVKEIHGFDRYRKVLLYWEKIAAVLFIPLLLSGLLYIYLAKPGTNNQEIYNEINIAFGTTSKLVLSDRTAVWLNSGSHLKYPLRFGKGMREVYLEGEAYFEIAEDETNPFVVQTPDLDIMATGTSFDVMAYPEENTTETTLVSGKISLIKELPNSNIQILTDLKPGERASFDKNKKRIELGMVDTDKVTSWKEGLLIFRNDPLVEIAKKLGRWFNTDIELVDDELKSYRYTATFSNESLFQILELLSMSAPIDYTYSPRIKNENNIFTKRKVKISLKR